MGMNYLVTKDQIVVIVKGEPIVVPNTNKAYEDVKDAIRTGDTKALTVALDRAKALQDYLGDGVLVAYGKVHFNGQELHGTLVNRIIQFMDEGLDPAPLTNFLTNLMKNPSSSSVEELYDFLEVGQFPITDDGHFLAWKKVTENYKDCHTGTFDNSIGAVLEMERNQVDDNRSQTCSRGFHVASFKYAKEFQSGKMLIVKINPADVVSVPNDYGNQKCRVSRYQVVDELVGASDIDVLANAYYDDHDGSQPEAWGITKKKKAKSKAKPKAKKGRIAKKKVKKGGLFKWMTKKNKKR